MWWSDWFNHGFWPWMLMGPTMMLLFIAACFSIGYLVVRAVRPSRAIDILRERFARGEIDEREFEQRRRLLQL
jgi:putative membrane protein